MKQSIFRWFLTQATAILRFARLRIRNCDQDPDCHTIVESTKFATEEPRTGLRGPKTNWNKNLPFDTLG